MSLTTFRSLLWPTRSPHSLHYWAPEPAAGLAERATARRYVETVASPSSQNRQGNSAPSPPGPLTPTRGPEATVAAGDSDDSRGDRAAGPRNTKGLWPTTVSMPL